MRVPTLRRTLAALAVSALTLTAAGTAATAEPTDPSASPHVGGGASTPTPAATPTPGEATPSATPAEPTAGATTANASPSQSATSASPTPQHAPAGLENAPVRHQRVPLMKAVGTLLTQPAGATADGMSKINTARAQIGLPRVAWSGAHEAAAKAHADYLYLNRGDANLDPNHEDPSKPGYTDAGAAIAPYAMVSAGAGNYANATELWLMDPWERHARILNPAASDIVYGSVGGFVVAVMGFDSPNRGPSRRSTRPRTSARSCSPRPRQRGTSRAAAPAPASGHTRSRCSSTPRSTPRSPT